MSKSRFLAKVLAFVMILSVFTAGQSILAFAQNVPLGFSEITVSVQVPGNSTVMAWIEPGSGIDITPMSTATNTTNTVQTMDIRLGVNAGPETAGQTFVVPVTFIGAEGGQQQVLTITVAQAAAQNAAIHLTSPTGHVEMQPGVSTTVEVTLRNFSQYEARQVTLLPRANPNANFTVETAGTISTFTLGAGSQRAVSLRITPIAGIAPNVNVVDVPFEISFRNNRNELQFAELNIPVRVVHPTAEDPHIFTEFSVSEGQIRAGQSYTVTATLRNTSSNAARNVQISAAGFTAHSMLTSPTTVFVGNIAAGQTQTATFTFTPLANVETGSHPINFNLRYETADGTAITDTQPFFVAVTGDMQAERARLTISSIAAPTGAFNAGEQGNFAVTVTNTGVGDARNVRVVSAPETGLVPRLSNTQTISALAAGESHTFEFAFAPTSAATGRFHHIDFTLTYNDGGTNQTTSNSSGMNVAGESGPTAELHILSISAPGGQFTAGQEARFSVLVTNTGVATARNIRLESSPGTGVVPRTASIQTIPTLEPGQSRVFDFTFAPTASATGRFHDVGFTLTYNNGNEEQTSTQYSGFNVDAPNDDETASVPRVIISDYTVDPLIVMANSEFDLFITLQNTHNQRTVRNMIVTWEVMGVATTPGTTAAPSAVFTPVNASNTFFVDSISPRGTSDHHLRLFAIPDATAMNHTIRITFIYEDDTGASHNRTEYIGVNVRQISRLDLGDPHVGDWQMMGMPIHMSFNVHNTSRSTLFILRVHFEGEGFDVSNADEVFGNFQAGHAGNFWGSVTPQTPGPATLYLVATWEDAMAEPHEIRRAFHMDVQGGFGGGDGFDDPFGGRPGMGGEDMLFCPECGSFVPEDECFVCGWINNEGGGIPGWIWIVAVGILAIGAAAVVTVVVLRKKKGNSQFEDMDDF
ncbi:MAG: NEW3 domain-containing protein [Defluviitaleaceae bacterium]|nr:NEW3 domain-containing protein [Defluviitaleaceae bacterium]